MCLLLLHSTSISIWFFPRWRNSIRSWRVSLVFCRCFRTWNKRWKTRSELGGWGDPKTAAFLWIHICHKKQALIVFHRAVEQPKLSPSRNCFQVMSYFFQLLLILFRKASTSLLWGHLRNKWCMFSCSLLHLLHIPSPIPALRALVPVHRPWCMISHIWVDILGEIEGPHSL